VFVSVCVVGRARLVTCDLLTCFLLANILTRYIDPVLTRDTIAQGC